MPDLRIPYVVADNYLGTKLANVVADFNVSYNSLLQVCRIIAVIGEDSDVETALGLPHDQDYGYHLKGLLATQKAAFDSLATDIGKIDKGI